MESFDVDTKCNLVLGIILNRFESKIFQNKGVIDLNWPLYFTYWHTCFGHFFNFKYRHTTIIRRPNSI